jgi:hypothetical protein
MEMLTVAADACCNQEGAAARKHLLPKAELKQVLAQCFALTAAHYTSDAPDSPKVCCAPCYRVPDVHS